MKLYSRTIIALMLAFGFQATHAATLVWTNLAGGNWTNAANWEPNLIPAPADTAIITNAGTYTVTINSAVNAASLLMGLVDTNATGIRTLTLAAGSLSLTNATLETNTVLNFNAGTITVRGLAEAKGDFNWTAGTLAGGGELRAGSAGSAVTISGSTAKSISTATFGIYSANTIWGGGNLSASAGSVFYNAGTISLTNDMTFTGGGTTTRFDNFGILTKNGGSGSLTLSTTQVRSTGNLNIFAGQLVLTSVTATNTGNLYLGATNQLMFNSGTFELGGSLTAFANNAAQFVGGSAYIVTTNISVPSILIAGATVYQQTNVVTPAINQSSGTWWLTLTTAVNNYNLTNGSLRGGTLTVTNFNWTDGALYANTNGDKLIIPATGTLNLLGAGEKSLYYFFPATLGYGIDNFGTWNWSGGCILRGFGSTVNNHGSVNLTASGNPYYSYYSVSYPTPRWNNFGTFTKTVGTGVFSFNGAIVNNAGLLDYQSGTGTFESGNKFTNSATVNVGAAAVLLHDSNSESTYLAGSSLTASTLNSVRIPGGTVYLQTTNVSTPSFWINGGTLFQQAPNAVNAVNQSSGTWWLTLTTAVNHYNLTNGSLRGGTLTVTNFNWTDGALYANTNGDKIVIPATGTLNLLGAGEKSLYYYFPATLGYGIDNFGTWNWSGGCILRGFGSTVNNHGSVNVTASGNPYYSYYSVSYPTPRWNNFGTFTKTVGTGAFSFNGAIVNNTGLLDYQSGTGTFESSTKFTNSANVNVGAAAVLLNDSSSESTYLAGSSLTASSANSVRIPSGTVYLQTTSVATPAIWISGGTLQQQAPNVVNTINQSAGNWWLTLTTAINNYNLTNGILRGGTLTVTNFNWTDGGLYANTNGDRLIIPITGTFNLLGAGEKSLFYYAPATLGYGIDNFGTWNWSGACLLRGFGSTVNNHGSVNVTASGNPYYSYYSVSYPTPRWNNFGTLTKTVGAGAFSFNGAIVNNTGLLDYQSGTGTFESGTKFTNSATVNVGAAALLLNDSSAESTYLAGSALTAPTLNSVRIPSGTVYLQTTNVSSPALWINGGTLQQHAPNVVNAINQSAGTWWLTLATGINHYNLTNGDLRGGTLTVTNFNWISGNLYANTNGDKLVIPATGTLNQLGNATRYLSYYSPATVGYGVDNFGSWNWASNSILYALQTGCTVNNHGTVNVSSATGDAHISYYPGYTTPTWNNFGIFNRAVGSGVFYFNGVFLNNTGTMTASAGRLSIYNGTKFTNSATVNITGGALFENESGALSTFLPASSLSAATTNAIRISSGTVYLQTTNVTTPALWINGGTLQQEVPNVVPTIHQSAGTWRLTVTTHINNYNFTNGELRGGTLTVTNFNWHGGNLYADASGDKTIIPASGTLNLLGDATRFLSYYSPATIGRSLDNFGTWNWTSNSILYALQTGCTVNNHGTVNVTGATGSPQFSSYPGYSAPNWNNLGTFNRSAGNGTFTFSGNTLTNSGTITVSSGSFTATGLFTQTGGSAHLGTNFTASSNVRIEGGSLTGRGSIAGTFYNNGVLNPGASPGLITGTSFTNTAAAIYNVELGGSTAPGTNYDQLRLTGPANLGGTLNVSFVNGFEPVLSNRFTILTTSARTGTFAAVNPPAGVAMDTIYSPTNVILEITGLTNAPLLILTNPVSQTIWTPDPVTFSVAVSGATPITFQWQFNSNNIPNATNLSYTIPAVTTNDAGLYTVLITDGNGGTTNASAMLTVIPFANTIYWTNLAGGNWSVPANWLPNRVPVASNNVAIISNGTYTVTVDIPAACSNLTVGAGSSLATQTVHLVSGQSLTLGGSSTWDTSTLFQFNGTLQMAGGSNDIAGRIEWQLGTLSGVGRTIIRTNATVTFIGSLNQKFIATNILENFGTLTYGGDSFGNAQLLRFSGGAQLTNHPSGLIYMGANALQYHSASTPRSYLVNLGTITAGSANVFSPSYISVDFLNYGTLTNNGYIYLSRGSNYGTVVFYNTLCELSVFGDETTGEYFSFEDGTTFLGAYPALAVGGYAQWNTTAVHPGKVTVLSGSGGASFADPEFRILKNYTQLGETLVRKGRWTQANPALVADLHILSDGIINGFHTFTITNAGVLRVNELSHTIRTLGNSGSILVRSNLALTGSSYTYGGGTILITNNATGTFSGGTVEAQFIDNRGTNTVNGAMAFTGGTHFYNRSGARTYFGGGSFGTGPASVLNEGLLDGYGGISALNVTNRATVLANDSLNRNLGLGLFIQESGLTELSPGQASGDLDIRGGLLSGTNAITGTLRNAAQFAPGKPFGLLSITGNHTNAATGTHFLPIQGAAPITGFPQTRVTGTAALAGTLYVNFTNGFTPAPGNLFTAMTFAARSGVFDAIVNDTYGLEAFYTSTTLVLRAENLLPNVNLVLPPGGSNFVCQPFRLDASATDPDGVVTNLTLTFEGSPLASSSGASVFGIVEKDFPSLNTVVATAIDDRGGVRSTTQSLSLVTAPIEVLMLGGIRSNTTFKICMTGLPGTNYWMLANTNLLTTNWVNLGLMENTNGIWRFHDANTITNLPRRYYRAVRQ